MFISPDTSKISSNYDGAIVGGYFYPEVISFFKNEEAVRRYGLFYDRYSRKKIDIRTLGRPLYIPEHAIKRLLERANSTYVSVTRSLWPGLLVTEALYYFAEPTVARPFPIPTTDGMFLCIAAMGKPSLDDTGFTKLTVTPSGHQHETTPCMEPLVSICLVSTFVSLSEMAPDQCQLRSALMELIERHRGVLTVAHLARVMSVDGNEAMRTQPRATLEVFLKEPYGGRPFALQAIRRLRSTSLLRQCSNVRPKRTFNSSFLPAFIFTWSDCVAAI